jgi:DNA-binding response OmpR family regulator
MAILHVEDQAVIREVVYRALEVHGFEVASVDSVGAAKRVLAERSHIAGALLDERLHDGSGLELYDWIAGHYPVLAGRVAFLTGSSDPESFEPLVAAGCQIIKKPFEIAELVRVVADWEGAADVGPR